MHEIHGVLEMYWIELEAITKTWGCSFSELVQWWDFPVDFFWVRHQQNMTIIPGGIAAEWSVVIGPPYPGPIGNMVKNAKTKFEGPEDWKTTSTTQQWLNMFQLSGL